MTPYAPAAPYILRPVTAPPAAPAPSMRPLNAWFPMPFETPMRMRHDNQRADWNNEPRTLSEKIKINPTNEITPCHPTNGDATKVHLYSKIEFKLARSWLDWIRFTHGDWAAQRIYTPGYGYFDGEGTNPDDLTPANAFKLLLGGGQLVNVRHKQGMWAFVEAQSHKAGPDYSITYENSPHLVLKQILVGHRQDKSMYLQVDKGAVGGVGDVYLPLVSNIVYPWLSALPMAAIELAYLEPFPALPFVGNMYGREVVVEQYAFKGSDVWGLVTVGLEPGWYLLEEMLIVGDINDRARGGSADDRRVYITPWLGNCPIPVIGWTRQS